jgi:hypothetical protein
MTTLSVTFDTDDRAAIALHRTVLASLPMSFTTVASGEGASGEGASGAKGVVVVAGTDEDWVGRVRRAVEGGARGVFIASPGRSDPAALRRLEADARSAGVAVLAAAPYRGGSTWADCLATIRQDLPTFQLVDSVVRVSGAGGSPVDRDALVRGLLEQLGLVEDLVERPVPLEVAHSSAGQYVVAGVAGPTSVTLTGVISPLGSEQLSLDAVGQDCRWSVRFDGDAPALPSQVTRWDRSGSRSVPSRYEGGYRRSWRLLHAAVETGVPARFTLGDLAARLAAMPALGPEGEER